MRWKSRKAVDADCGACCIKFCSIDAIRRGAPVTARSKAWVCDRSLAGTAGSNTSLSVASVVCCQVAVCASG